MEPSGIAVVVLLALLLFGGKGPSRTGRRNRRKGYKAPRGRRLP